MTAHELARLLLAGPDVTVLKETGDGTFEARAPEYQFARRYGSGGEWSVIYWPELPDDEDDPPRQEIVTL